MPPFEPPLPMDNIRINGNCLINGGTFTQTYTSQNDVQERTFTQRLSFQGHDIRCAYSFSPDGQRIIHGCAVEQRVEISGKIVMDDTRPKRIRLPGMKASFVRLSSNGERLLSIYIKKNLHTITLWNTTTRRPLYNSIPTSIGEDTFLQVSPDCLKVLASSTRTHVLNTADGRLVEGISAHGKMSCAAFSNDGRTIVSVRSNDGGVIVWDIKAATISGPYEGAGGCVKSVAISPDRKRIVLGSTDGGIALMEALTGTVTGYFEGHEDIVQSLAFSADGKWIVSASSDKTVRVWDVETRDLNCPPLGHMAPVVLAFFSPDKSSILSQGDDEMIRVWTLQ